MVPHPPTPGNDSLPQSVALTCGRARATAAPAIAADLELLLQQPADAWPAAGLQRIKQRSVRQVYQGELGGVPVHVKVYRVDTFVDRARDALRGPRGDREAKNLLLARALALPAVEPLATGHAVVADGLASFVVTRSVDGAPFTFAAATDVLRRVGALLRTLHDRSLQPGDLHPGNLLIDRDGGLHLLDLTSVRRVETPELGQRADALAFFCQELEGGPLDPRASPLLQGYLDAGVCLPTELRQQLRLSAQRRRTRGLVAFGRRATRACRHTEVEPRRRAEPRWFWHLGEASSGDDLPREAQRAACRAAFASPPSAAKAGRRGAVWLHQGLAIKERDAGRARRLWLASYWLLFARVAIPRPIALCLFAGRGFAISRELPNMPLALEVARGQLTAAEITAAARSLGENVGRLHAHGLGNRDLKLENLVRDPADGAVNMVDLDGVRRRAVADHRGRGGDLGRLLAAFRGAGCPGGEVAVRTFLRGYLRAHRRLLRQPR